MFVLFPLFGSYCSDSIWCAWWYSCVSRTHTPNITNFCLLCFLLSFDVIFIRCCFMQCVDKYWQYNSEVGDFHVAHGGGNVLGGKYIKQFGIAHHKITSKSSFLWNCSTKQCSKLNLVWLQILSYLNYDPQCLICLFCLFWQWFHLWFVQTRVRNFTPMVAMVVVQIYHRFHLRWMNNLKHSNRLQLQFITQFLVLLMRTVFFVKLSITISDFTVALIMETNTKHRFEILITRIL